MSSEYFILRQAPENFKPTMIASGCCLTVDDKILLLKRHPEKAQGNTWGVPGGKIEENESIRECVIREIKEEAGVDIDDEALRFVGTLYCSVPEKGAPLHYIFHTFHKNFMILPELDIALNENVEAKWVTLEEGHLLPLMLGGKEVLEYYQEFICINSSE